MLVEEFVDYWQLEPFVEHYTLLHWAIITRRNHLRITSFHNIVKDTSF